MTQLEVSREGADWIAREPAIATRGEGCGASEFLHLVYGDNFGGYLRIDRGGDTLFVEDMYSAAGEATMGADPTVGVGIYGDTATTADAVSGISALVFVLTATAPTANVKDFSTAVLQQFRITPSFILALDAAEGFDRSRRGDATRHVVVAYLLEYIVPITTADVERRVEDVYTTTADALDSVSLEWRVTRHAEWITARVPMPTLGEWGGGIFEYGGGRSYEPWELGLGVNAPELTSASRPSTSPERTAVEWQSAWPRVASGEEFLQDDGGPPPALWGTGDEVAWVSGEACMLCAPIGVGKTTVAHALLKAMARISPPVFLGLEVRELTGKALLIAADRPRQIKRSLLRGLSSEAKRRLQERLVVSSAPSVDVARDPDGFAGWIRSLDVEVVIVDSLKDLTSDLTKAETGSAIARAFELIVSSGIDLLVLHHQRKATSDNRTPHSIDDVYGSAWLTAKAGSVLFLAGKAGDRVVELRQLKSPMTAIGPLKIQIGHASGSVTLPSSSDIPAALRAAHPGGLSAREVAELSVGTPTPAKVERARRDLVRLVDEGVARAKPSGQGRTALVRYVLAELQDD